MDAVAGDASEISVHRRADRHSVLVAKQEASENQRADIEGRSPHAIAGRIDKALLSDAAQESCDAVREPGFAIFDERAGGDRMSFDGDVAVVVHGELRADPNGEPGQLAQIRRHSVLLHPRVHDDCRRL